MHLYNGLRQLSQWQSTMPCAIEANYQDADVFLQFEGNGQQAKVMKLPALQTKLTLCNVCCPYGGDQLFLVFLDSKNGNWLHN